MKKIATILLTGLIIVMCFSSCADQFDDPSTGNAYGNNTINLQRTTTIAQLKKEYATHIVNNTYTQITQTTRIEGIIVGDDESGNIYKQLFVKDETGIISISINANGLYATCPVGQKVIIDCKGLYIGSRKGKQVQIGGSNSSTIGYMELYTWKEHVRLINKPSLWYDELKPIIVDSEWLKTNTNLDEAPYLVKLENVTIKEADGTTMFAPDELKDAGNGVDRTAILEDNSELKLRISAYCNFSTEIMPTKPVTITVILTRYNNDWQLTLRTLDDIKIN